MPTVAGRRSSPVSVVKTEIGDSSPHKRKLRSDSAPKNAFDPSIPSPMNWKSTRRCLYDSPKTNTPSKTIEKISGEKVAKSNKSPVKKRLSNSFIDKPIWNPTDMEHLNSVKEALHVSNPPTVVCRENEQSKVLEFCKKCIEQESSGSLYVCGCPGTGKSLLMEKVKEALVEWAKEAGLQPPEVVSINCMSLANTLEIFNKILGRSPPRKKSSRSILPLKTLQNSYSQKQNSYDADSC